MPSADSLPPTSIESLQQLAALIDAGRAEAALTLARDLFARGDVPAWLVADLCNLAGVAALALGLDAVAEQMWRHAIAGNPQLATVHAQLGRLLARQLRDDEAEACCRAALACDEQHLDALLTLAALLARHRRDAEAEACYAQALQAAPHSVAAHADFGALLVSLGRLADAERCLMQALALEPDDPAALTNLGLLLAKSGRQAEAEPCHRRALANAPAHAPTRSAILCNLGNLLAELRRDDEAETCLREAISIDPASAAAHCNLGVLLRDTDRPEEAESSLRQALALRPDYRLAEMHLSSLLLARGAFAEGWRLHEARHDPELRDNGIPPPPFAMRRWQGEPSDGLSLLVWPEQGLGDQIQFARFAPLLKQRGAARVTLVCQRPLKRLFDTLEGIDEVFAADVVDNRFSVPGVDLSHHDRWVFPLSLPHALGIELDTLPAAIPYLQAPAERLAEASQRLAPRDGRLRVGLVWRGNPKHDNDADRSLPGLATLAPLWSVPGVSFISLQAGSAGGAAHEPPAGQPLQHLGGGFRDFADTAAVLANIDLLICVDTSIAHLAGALGRPCWVLLPRHKTDWRWLEERDDSPWYPGTLRLFRQAKRGDWTPLIEAVREALDQCCAMRSSTALNCLA